MKRSTVHQFLKNLDALAPRNRDPYMNHQISSATTAKQNDSNNSYHAQESSERPLTPKRTAIVKKLDSTFSQFSALSPSQRPKNATQVIYRAPTGTAPLPQPIQTSKRMKKPPTIINKSKSSSTFITHHLPPSRASPAVKKAPFQNEAPTSPPGAYIGLSEGEIESGRGVDTQNEEMWIASDDKEGSVVSELEHVKMVLCRENLQRMGAEEQVQMLTARMVDARQSADQSKAQILRMRQIIKSLKENRTKEATLGVSLKQRLLETSRLLHHALSNQVLLLQYFDKSRKLLGNCETPSQFANQFKKLLDRDGPRLGLVALDRESMENILRKNKDLITRDLDISEEINPNDYRLVYPSKPKHRHNRSLTRQYFNSRYNSASCSMLNETASQGLLMSTSTDEVRNTLDKIENMQQRLQSRHRFLSAPGSARQVRGSDVQDMSFSQSCDTRKLQLLNQALCRATIQREELAGALEQYKQENEQQKQQISNLKESIAQIQSQSHQQEKWIETVQKAAHSLVASLLEEKEVTNEDREEWGKALNPKSIQCWQEVHEKIKKMETTERELTLKVLQGHSKEAQVLESLIDTYGGLAKIGEAFGTNDIKLLKIIGRELVEQLKGLYQAKSVKKKELLQLRRRISQDATDCAVNTVLPYLQPNDETSEHMSQISESDTALPSIVLTKVEPPKPEKQPAFAEDGLLMSMIVAQAATMEEILK